MTMHLMSPACTTTGKHKSKRKFKNAAEAAKARRNAEAWNQLLEKYDVKPPVRRPAKLASVPASSPVYRREPGTGSIPSLDTRSGVATKPNQQQYTGSAMIGIGQLHKSNAIPIFQAEDAVDIAKMRRN